MAPTATWRYDGDVPLIMLTWPVPMATDLGQAPTAFQVDLDGEIFSVNNGIGWITGTLLETNWDWSGLPYPIRIRQPAIDPAIQIADHTAFPAWDWIDVPARP